MEIRTGIATAVKKQRKRQGVKNALLSPQEISEVCKISGKVKDVLDSAIERYEFSPRAVSSCIKISRTIADIDDSDDILPEHMSEAVSFRKLCSTIPPEIA